MLFNSLEFVLFFAVVYIVYRRLSHVAQNVFLLAASYFFYASWDWRFLSLILLSTIVDFYCGRRIEATDNPAARRNLLLLSLAFNLGLLGVFKYFNFFASSLNDLAGSLGIALDAVTLKIILPVGISFYTFQTLSYTIDVYRRQLRAEPNFVNFALFVAFFPQLVAGPIERASRLLPQMRRPRVVREEDLMQGVWFVFWGAFLKVFVADNLGPIADRAFDPGAPVDGVSSLIGVYAFAFQIFGDFAGYSSIAIGTARMLGFHLSTNFLFPYWVTNPRDFWRNWHISLSTWLRDYLYIPLGGGRGSPPRVAGNLMLTMLLGGLWHGAAWTFVLWGLYQGALLIAHRAVESVAGPARAATSAPMAGLGWVLKVAFMFQLTCLGWLIFRASSLEQVWDMAASIVTALHWPTTTQAFDIMQVLFFTALVLAIQATQLRAGGRTDLGHFPPWLRAATAGAMCYALVIWGSFGESPFIYFQF